MAAKADELLDPIFPQKSLDAVRRSAAVFGIIPMVSRLGRWVALLIDIHAGRPRDLHPIVPQIVVEIKMVGAHLRSRFVEDASGAEEFAPHEVVVDGMIDVDIADAVRRRLVFAVLRIERLKMDIIRASLDESLVRLAIDVPSDRPDLRVMIEDRDEFADPVRNAGAGEIEVVRADQYIRPIEEGDRRIRLGAESGIEGQPFAGVAPPGEVGIELDLLSRLITVINDHHFHAGQMRLDIAYGSE